jgi:hypothetical protein
MMFTKGEQFAHFIRRFRPIWPSNVWFPAPHGKPLPLTDEIQLDPGTSHDASVRI